MDPALRARLRPLTMNLFETFISVGDDVDDEALRQAFRHTMGDELHDQQILRVLNRYVGTLDDVLMLESIRQNEEGMKSFTELEQKLIDYMSGPPQRRVKWVELHEGITEVGAISHPSAFISRINSKLENMPGETRRLYYHPATGWRLGQKRVKKATQ